MSVFKSNWIKFPRTKIMNVKLKTLSTDGSPVQMELRRKRRVKLWEKVATTLQC